MSDDVVPRYDALVFFIYELIEENFISANSANLQIIKLRILRIFSYNIVGVLII